MDLKRIIIILIACVIIIGAIYIYTESNNNQKAAFHDMGTSGNKSTDWICSNTSFIQITPNGTTINNTSPEKIAYVAHSTDFWAKTPLCIEFNVVDTTGTPRIQIFDENNNFYENLAPANGSHVKILINDSVSWQIGDTEQTPINTSMKDCNIRFVVLPNNAITYNDFKIYSI